MKSPRGVSTLPGLPVVTLVTTGTDSGITPWYASADSRLT